jgi:uncharacterized protein (TIGR03086 family)
MIDMTPATTRTADLVINVDDGQLGARTPCELMTAAALLSHIGDICVAFTDAAAKRSGVLTDKLPEIGEHLVDDWRTVYPDRLATLDAAWQDPEAWKGSTRAASLDFTGDRCGLVTLTEVVVHGWDLARATGQPYSVDDALLDAVHTHVTWLVQQGPDEHLFKKPVPVPDDAPLLDRVIGLTGRDPGWTA